MKQLYVVTHAQSVHHIEHKVGGWYDTPLTEKGRLQAELISARLAVLAGDSEVEIFSSDLLRASQTAEAIAERFKVEPIFMHGLREMSSGIAEGRPRAWRRENEVPAPDHNRLDHDGGFEGAETKRMLATRVYAALDVMLASQCQTQIVVTHGFALTFFVAAWVKMAIEDVGYINLPVASGSITHLRQNEFWQDRSVVSLGDASHLAAM